MKSIHQEVKGKPSISRLPFLSIWKQGISAVFCQKKKGKNWQKKMNWMNMRYLTKWKKWECRITSVRNLWNRRKRHAGKKHFWSRTGTGRGKGNRAGKAGSTG